MKPVAESSKAADTERFEREVGVWKPTGQKEKGQRDNAARPTKLNNQMNTRSK